MSKLDSVVLISHLLDGMVCSCEIIDEYFSDVKEGPADWAPKLQQIFKTLQALGDGRRLIPDEVWRRMQATAEADAEEKEKP